MNTKIASDLVKLPPIEKMVIKGVELTLAQTFDFSASRISFISSNDRLRIAQLRAEKDSGAGTKIGWPLVFLRLMSVSTGVSEQLHGFNSKAAARHGMYMKLNDNQSAILKHNLVPAVFEIEVAFLTDDFNTAFDFTSKWISTTTHNRLNFTITYMNTPLDIRVELSPTMSTPDRDASVDMPSTYEYVGTFKVVGYVTDPHPDATSNIQLLRKPVVNVTMGDMEAEDAQVWSSKHVPAIKKDHT